MFSLKSKSVAIVSVVVLLLQLATSMAEDNVDIPKNMQICFKEGQLSNEEIRTIQNDDTMFTDPNVAEKLKCFVACIYKHMGLVDDKGMPNEAQILKFNQEIFKDKKDILPAAISKCSGEVQKETGCTMSYKYQQCIRREVTASDNKENNKNNAGASKI